MTVYLEALGRLADVTGSLEARISHEDGQDMIEYALLAALVSVVAVAVIMLIGPYMKDMFQDVVNALGQT